jgi:hypothetical protein
MTLKTLFDKGRRSDIQRALEKGEPISFAGRMAPQPPVLVEDDYLSRLRMAMCVPTGKFIVAIRQSNAPTKERMEYANSFVRQRIHELTGALGVSKIIEDANSAKNKLQQAAKGAVVSITPLEQELIDLNALDRLASSLKMQIDAASCASELLKGKVGP